MDIEKILALESKLRDVETCVRRLRLAMMKSPEYKGDWRASQWWKDCRRQWRLLSAEATDTLKKRHHSRGENVTGSDNSS